MSAKAPVARSRTSLFNPSGVYQLVKESTRVCVQQLLHQNNLVRGLVRNLNPAELGPGFDRPCSFVRRWSRSSGPAGVAAADNKGAYDLCHRFTSAQHSRHIDRKLFKMREKRGAGQVCVRYVPTNDNTSDIFTKILARQLFEKHRRTVLNLAGAK